MLTASVDKTAQLWPVLSAGVPPPDWCSDFLVWLGGKRIAPDGRIETLSGDELLELEARLRPHMNEDTDYARLLRWRLLAAEERPVDPYGTTAPAHARIEEGGAEKRHLFLPKRLLECHHQEWPGIRALSILKSGFFAIVNRSAFQRSRERL